MATPLPAGWSANGLTEYQATLKDSAGNDFIVNIDVQTGQRQIYTPIPLGRQYIATVNANGKITYENGSTTPGTGWTNISRLGNGTERLKSMVSTSKISANKIVGLLGTEEQKKRLAEQKEYSQLKSALPPSRSPGEKRDPNPDAGGPQETGETTGGGTPFDVLGTFRNVSNYQSEETNYGTWKYPLIMNELQDHIMISTYNYQVADVFKNSETGQTSVNTGLILAGESLSKRTLKNVLGYVMLPMPSNISEANQTGWGDDSLNSLTAGLMGGALSVASFAASGNLLEAGTATIETAKSVFKNEAASTRIKQLLTLNAGAAVVKKLGVSVNAEAYRARVTGTAINPNLELLFQGPKLRQFQFSYKLAPRSAAEAKQIRGIIKFFKKAMAPKRSGSAADSFFLGAPNVFRVKFLRGKNELNTLPTLKTCALVNFNVNYTADGFYSSYMDGQPVSVQIELAFAELTPIYNDNYGDNPDDDRVGFPGGSDGVDNLENPLFDPKDEGEKAANASTPRTQDPNSPGAGTRPGSPVPPLVIGVDDTVGSPNNRPPLAGSPGTLALPAN